MIRVIGVIELALVVTILWLLINVLHATWTGGSKDIENGFFWLSNQIKKNNKKENKK